MRLRVEASITQGDEPCEEKTKRLVAESREQQSKARRLEDAIWKT